MRKLMFPGCLAAIGCASQNVQPIGANQYMVTASCSVWYCSPSNAAPNQALAKANETCGKLGKSMNLLSMETGTNIGYPRYAQAKFECR